MLTLALAILLNGQAEPWPVEPRGIIPHDVQTFVRTFAELCVANELDPAEQERIALQKGFAPTIGPGTPPAGLTSLHRQSVGLSIRRGARDTRCSVSGSTNKAVSLDQLGELVTATLETRPHDTAVMGKGSPLAREAVLWRPLRNSSDSWSFATASPQAVKNWPAGSTHVVLTLVTPLKAQE